MSEAVLLKPCERPLSRTLPEAEAEAVTCVGCGCTDNQACDGGCDWLVVNRVTKRGVCSSCETHRAAFESEQRVQEFRETLV